MGASASPTIISRFVALPGDFSGRQSKWKGGRQGQCCISVRPALQMGPCCSGPAPCVERLTITAELLGYTRTVPSAPYGSSEFLLTRLAQEAVTRTSPVPQGGTMARGGRVTDLYSQLVSGGGKALNPHCGTRVGQGRRGRDVGHRWY